MRTLEDYKKIADENKKKKDKLHEECEEARRKELEKQGIIVDSSGDKKEKFHGDCDHPNTMENGTAVFLYVIVMIIGAIFNDRWLIWIVATAVFLKFITRHKK